ncbi:MAG: hypothetical protein ACK2UM_02010 [Anaerolineales bacterium]|jgi:hypothetical protein
MTTEVTDTTGQDALLREHELAGERSQEMHYFKVKTFHPVNLFLFRNEVGYFA